MFYLKCKNTKYVFVIQKITSTVEMKDSSSDAVQIVYYSSCLSGKELTQTNKCDGLKVIYYLNIWFWQRNELFSAPDLYWSQIKYRYICIFRVLIYQYHLFRSAMSWNSQLRSHWKNVPKTAASGSRFSRSPPSVFLTASPSNWKWSATVPVSNLIIMWVT